MTNQEVRRVVYGSAFVQGAPKALALTGVCLAVLAAWQPRYGAADAGVDRNGAANAEAEASDNAAANASAIVGAWDGPYCWPIVATHLAHLPPSGESETGRVLMWPADPNTPDTQAEAWLWNLKPGCFSDNPAGNPNPECFTEVTNNTTNIFCAGQTALADGTILIAGGHRGSVNGNDVGLFDTNHFIRDPVTGEWGVWKTFEDGMPEMAEPRWYPTVTTLPDGSALVVSGSNSRCSGNGAQCDPDPPPGPGCPGNESCDRVIVEIPEIYDPAAAPLGWTPLTVQTDTPYYPLNFVLPNGKVLYAGAEGPGGGSPSIPPTETWVLDVDADTWTEVPNGNSSIPGGSAVMFEPGKVLKSGGGNPAVAGAAVFDSTVDEQDWEWMDVNPMNNERRRHQLTMLPDGTILATGGTRSGNREYTSFCDGGTRDGKACSIPGLPPGLPDCPGNTDVGNCPVNCVNGLCDGGPMDGMPCPPDGCPDACMEDEQRWVAVAEIYDPAANNPAWIEMAEMKTPRMYHSTALLLPDGRVLSAGGGPVNFGGAIRGYRTVEFFSPPYFFKERPEITFAPKAICYGSTFRMASSDAVDVDRVTLIRLGTVTHSFDSDQRFQELTIDSQVDNQLDVVAPDNANVAPPGYYMLFVLSEDADVPSVAEYVLVAESFCEPRSQGYWHRQCLGVPASEGGIDPGNGQGPQAPTEPGFVEGLMPCAEDRLADLGLNMTTCEGMDADPPNDPCERAKKQLTALILNVCSGKLTECCEVDLGAEGCASTNVGDLIDEIAGLIQGGSCKTASNCAAAVNGSDPGDFDGNGFVDVLDLLILLAHWGDCPVPPEPCSGDLDGDGAVGVPDLLILFGYWS